MRQIRGELRKGVLTKAGVAIVVTLLCSVASVGGAQAEGSGGSDAHRAGAAPAASTGGAEAPSETATGAPLVSSDPVAYRAALASPDWVKTPNGLMYKTCVHSLPAGARMEGGSIVLASGVKQPPFKPCAHPRLVKPAAGVGHVPASNGWFISSWWNSPSYLRGITSDYTVPSAPSVNGAINFFFSSLENSTGTDIVQAVLSYGANSGVSGSGNFWYANAWYVWGSNSVHGPTIPVSTGDTIASSALGNECYSDGTHCYWTISATDTRTGQKSQIVINSYQSYNAAQGGVFESYGAQHCDWLPSNGEAKFSNIKVFNGVGAQVTPSFSTWQPDPECSMYQQSGSSSTDIRWTP